ncbi:MAG: hypothetical protein JNL96_17210 [Planctomycetaceae bacterium]|nr:hypothetical protein [Planctomycetaceae bacterium]
MELSAVEIERLVRDVMSRLQADAASPPKANENNAGALLSAGEKVSPGRVKGLQSIAGSVISLADVEGKLTDVTTLAVGPRAVVTPAVRDLLRQRKIELVRDGAVARRNASNDVATKPNVAVAVAAKQYAAGRLVERLRRDGYAVQQLAQVGLAAAVRELGDEAVKGGMRGLLIADEAEVAVIALNRARGVRAIAGEDATAVARATGSVGANVLVVDPRRKNDFLIERLTKAWLTAKSTACPATLELLR